MKPPKYTIKDKLGEALAAVGILVLFLGYYILVV